MRSRLAFRLLAASVLLGGPCTAAERAASADRPCPGYGAGFVRAPGSPTCIRLSGRVGAGADLRARTDAATIVARLAVDSRTESDLGPIRTYVRIGNGHR